MGKMMKKLKAETWNYQIGPVHADDAGLHSWRNITPLTHA